MAKKMMRDSRYIDRKLLRLASTILTLLVVAPEASAAGPCDNLYSVKDVELTYADVIPCLKEIEESRRHLDPRVVVAYSGSMTLGRDTPSHFNFNQRLIDTDDKVVTGEGWHFNAPYKGLYAVSISFYLNFDDRKNVNPYTTCAIHVLPGKELIDRRNAISHSFDLQCQLYDIVDLDQGDKVFIKVSHSFSDQSVSEKRTFVGTFNAHLLRLKK